MAEGTDSKSWQTAHARAHRQIDLFELLIDRLFRYVEMIGVIALLLVAAGDGHPALGALIAAVGSLLAGFHVALPAQRLLIDAAQRGRWGNSPRKGLWIGGALAGVVASVSFLGATALAELIKAAMQAS